jgi:hypothetical protein
VEILDEQHVRRAVDQRLQHVALVDHAFDRRQAFGEIDLEPRVDRHEPIDMGLQRIRAGFAADQPQRLAENIPLRINRTNSQ